MKIYSGKEIKTILERQKTSYSGEDCILRYRLYTDNDVLAGIKISYRDKKQKTKKQHLYTEITTYYRDTDPIQRLQTETKMFLQV